MRWSRPIERPSRRLAIAAVMGAALSGCGGEVDTLPREAISGTVDFAGKPLKEGMIQFTPSDGNAATAGGAAIKEGAYSVSKAEGLVPGNYKVMITSAPTTSSTPAGAMPGDAPPPAKEPIPAKYNSKSDLKAEIKKGGPNEFPFKLDAK